MPRHVEPIHLAAKLLLVALFVSGPWALAAEPPCPCPPAEPPPPPLWTGSLGLSYLATSGNSDTSSFGLAAGVKRLPTPWGLEIAALANRAETEGVKNVDRLYGSVRGTRRLDETFDLFAGTSYERDRFAGFDRRVVLEAGVVWHLLRGPVHDLALDGGGTWTTQDPVVGRSDDSFGALAGVAYVWKFGSSASLRERAVFYPNLSDSSAWRFRSETSVEATLAAEWALRVGYLYTRVNAPPPGFEKTDTATSVSVVWKR